MQRNAIRAGEDPTVIGSAARLVADSRGTYDNSLNGVSRRQRLKARLLGVLALTWLLAAAAYTSKTIQSGPGIESTGFKATLRRAPYAEWVHGVWVRVSSDTTSFNEVISEVSDVAPAGAVVVLDNAWTGAGPAAANHIRDAVAAAKRARARVVASGSPCVEPDTELFREAKRLGHLLDEGKTGGVEVRRSAPKLSCAFLDFTSPRAVEWWSQNGWDRLMQLGVDGVDVLAIDAAFADAFGSKGVIGAAGHLTRETWGHAMYHQLFDMGRKSQGFDFGIMARPVDTVGQLTIQNFAPQDLSFATMVRGPVPPSFEGLRSLLLSALHSSRQGYANVGIDVPAATAFAPSPEEEGRFAAVGSDGEGLLTCLRHQELLVRSAQLAAVLPVFELRGPLSGLERVCSNKLEAGSMVGALISRAAAMHAWLGPYYHSIASANFFAVHDEGAEPPSHRLNETIGAFPHVVLPLHEDDIHFSDPDTWDFLIGTDIFVAPIIKSHLNVAGFTTALQQGVWKQVPSILKGAAKATRNVTFPPFGQWVPLLHTSSTAGGFFPPKTTALLDFEVGEFPIYRRRGAIVPVDHRELMQSKQTGVGPTNVRCTHCTVALVDRPALLRPSAFRRRRRFPSDLLPKDGKPSPLGFDPRDEDAPMVEHTTVYGEHDTGLVISYTTTLVDPHGPTSGPFFIRLRISQFHRQVIVGIRGVRCAGCRLENNGGNQGFRLRNGGPSDLQQASAGGMGRVVLLDIKEPASDVWVVDPFSSLGADLTLGPFVAV